MGGFCSRVIQNLNEKITKDPVIESAKLVFHERNSEELSNLINIANASGRLYGNLNVLVSNTSYNTLKKSF